MENKSKNSIIIIILTIIILGLSAFIIYDKLINTSDKDNQNEIANNDNQNETNENNEDNQNEIANNDNQNETTENNEDLLAKFVGKYQYGERQYDCPPTVDGYVFLELKKDGTYTYTGGNNCAGGYSAKGNYAISHDKIYLLNDDCKLNETGFYPNCSPRYEVNYTETDGIINIFYGNESVKLEKTDEFKK